MAQRVPVAIAAMAIAMLVMVASAGSLATFVERHPSMKVFALSFPVLTGVLLVAEG